MEQEYNKVKVLLPGELLPTNSSAVFRAGYLLTDTAKDTLANTQVFAINSLVYDPVKNDFVLGVVRSRLGQNYVVDINSPLDCLLGQLDFDGADKRSRPNISVGATVYCRVSEYNADVGGRVSCLNKGFSAGAELGEIKGGGIVRTQRHLHALVEGKLAKLGQRTKFEAAMGKNGLIWVKGGTDRLTMLLCNIIQELISHCTESRFEDLLTFLK